MTEEESRSRYWKAMYEQERALRVMSETAPDDDPLTSFCADVADWFGDSVSFDYAYLGLVQEIGEVARFRMNSGTLTDAQYTDSVQLASGCLMVYLAILFNTQGWSLRKVIDSTWAKTRQSLAPTPLKIVPSKP